jgi:uncharacterized membrane protein YeaQ/YmgE (transglycosylase-associated protein family)
MDEKVIYSFGTTLVLGGILIASWVLGKDGVITTALVGLIGANIGTIMGFSLSKNTGGT